MYITDYFKLFTRNYAIKKQSKEFEFVLFNNTEFV